MTALLQLVVLTKTCSKITKWGAMDILIVF